MLTADERKDLLNYFRGNTLSMTAVEFASKYIDPVVQSALEEAAKTGEDPIEVCNRWIRETGGPPCSSTYRF